MISFLSFVSAQCQQWKTCYEHISAIFLSDTLAYLDLLLMIYVLWADPSHFDTSWGIITPIRFCRHFSVPMVKSLFTDCRHFSEMLFWLINIYLRSFKFHQQIFQNFPYHALVKNDEISNYSVAFFGVENEKCHAGMPLTPSSEDGAFIHQFFIGFISYLSPRLLDGHAIQ